MKSYVIHFIRHGAIDETLSGKYIGVTDVSLSEEGKKALRQLAENYSYPKTQVVFTSPLKRCTETCQILIPISARCPSRTCANATSASGRARQPTS